MSEPVDPPKPVPSDASDADGRRRQAREAAALRENLRRRKQQIRARQHPAAPDPAAGEPTIDLPAAEPG